MSFKVIDGDGTGREERDLQRDREFAEADFSWALREMAANMLRIIRGAGKSYELLAQMKKTIDSAIKFQGLHGHFPQVSNYLEIEDKHQKIIERRHAGDIDQASIDRWWKDGTFEKMIAEHTIMCGAFQAVASQLIGQRTQENAGERELHDGIRDWIRVRDARIQKDRPATLARRSAPNKRKAGKSNKPIDF